MNATAPRSIRSVRIELQYDLDALGVDAWTALVFRVDDSVLTVIAGASAHAVLQEAARAADRYVAETV